jgi:hypothetical protein
MLYICSATRTYSGAGILASTRCRRKKLSSGNSKQAVASKSLGESVLMQRIKAQRESNSPSNGTTLVIMESVLGLPLLTLASVSNINKGELDGVVILATGNQV